MNEKNVFAKDKFIMSNQTEKLAESWQLGAEKDRWVYIRHIIYRLNTCIRRELPHYWTIMSMPWGPIHFQTH
jgi:hypothetical protein